MSAPLRSLTTLAFLLVFFVAQMRAQGGGRVSDSAATARRITAAFPGLPFLAAARRLLARDLQGSDRAGARDVLRTIDRTDASALTGSERLLAETMLADIALLRDTARLGALMEEAVPAYGEHPDYHDRLYPLLREALRTRAESVAAALDERAPSDAERMFFNLLINHLFVSGLRGREELNGRVEKFAGQYPASQLVPLARRYIHRDYGEVPFGAAFSAGYGVGRFSGDLGGRFAYAHGPLLAGELYIREVTVAASFLFGVAHASSPFTVRGSSWPQGNAELTSIALDVGYEFRNGRLAVTPFAGLGVQNMSVRTTDDTAPEPPHTGDAIGYDIGVMVGCRVPFDVGPHLDFRARVGCTHTGLSSYDPSFSGSFWYVTLGFALVQRPYEGK
ncbi:MAG TPA: hypothetical protein VHI13_19100 [Candidatus Kapabacteria bacterium]|nr:hypothetical protein [Candidatus Kapabacteria bacterium]